MLSRPHGPHPHPKPIQPMRPDRVRNWAASLGGQEQEPRPILVMMPSGPIRLAHVHVARLTLACRHRSASCAISIR
jgi:hypothetical protein